MRVIIAIALCALVPSLAVSGEPLRLSDDVLKAYSECVKTLTQEDADLTEALPSCQTAADAGIPGAMVLLADALFTIDREGNLPTVARLFQQAAETGHPGALFTLGLLQVQGIGFQQDQASGIENVRRSYCEGYPPAQAFAEQSGLELQCNEAGDSAASGVWVGELKHAISPRRTFPDQEVTRVRLDFSGDRPKVSMERDGDWREVKPGAFNVSGLRANAVLTAVDDGWDYDGRWIETWSFTLTLTPDGRADTVWVRQVANIHAPANMELASFTQVSTGLLQRPTE